MLWEAGMEMAHLAAFYPKLRPDCLTWQRQQARQAYVIEAALSPIGRAVADRAICRGRPVLQARETARRKDSSSQWVKRERSCHIYSESSVLAFGLRIGPVAVP
jgi:hypothetical protein